MEPVWAGACRRRHAAAGRKELTIETRNGHRPHREGGGPATRPPPSLRQSWSAAAWTNAADDAVPRARRAAGDEALDR